MKRYLNVRFSDPQFERDHLRLMTFRSPALGGRGDVTIFLPPGWAEMSDLDLIILLHGVYCSHWAWALKGGVHLTALDLIEREKIRPMIIAMPSDGLRGDGSGYVKHSSADYESWIVEDVVGCLTQEFTCLRREAKFFLGGLSMGGYGALRLGAKFAHLVKGVSAHSAVTHLHQLARFIEEPLPDSGEFGAEDLDVLYWMKRNKEELPPVRFDCGLGDELIETNRQLHQALMAHEIPHRYFEFEGDHSWPYWQTHIADSLLFFSHDCS